MHVKTHLTHLRNDAAETFHAWARVGALAVVGIEVGSLDQIWMFSLFLYRDARRETRPYRTFRIAHGKTRRV